MENQTVDYDPVSLSKALLKAFRESYDELDEAFKKAKIDNDEELQWLLHLFVLTMGHRYKVHYDPSGINNHEDELEFFTHVNSNRDLAAKYELPVDKDGLSKLIWNENSIYQGKKLKSLEWLLFAQVIRDAAGLTLRDEDSDGFVGLFIEYKFCYGAYIAQDKHSMMRTLQARLIGSMAHERTNKIRQEIEVEYSSRKKHFKRRGYSAAFKKEMGEKYPEITESKTIERWISEFNKLNDEIPRQ